jgi:hypothetical protein
MNEECMFTNALNGIDKWWYVRVNGGECIQELPYWYLR